MSDFGMTTEALQPVRDTSENAADEADEMSDEARIEVAEPIDELEGHIEELRKHD